MRARSLPLPQLMPWLALLLSVAVMADIPYNPTRVLQNDNTLYVFRPSSQSDTQFQLVSVDVSSRVFADNLLYNTLDQSLPFLKDGSKRAFTPVLGDGGNLTVYTGDCAQGASGSEVWTRTMGTNDAKSNGEWKKQSISGTDNKHAPAMGANFLSGGMAFSATVGVDGADTTVYMFGGMCATQSTTATNWQSAANYSNLMVTLQSPNPGLGASSYQLDISSSRGPPVPEAGFTITGLSPTYSNHSDGVQTQQQNFVLIGGHTSAAFINMSQVALFSLPEQGWTFIGVEQPDAGRTDLAVRAEPTTVDPRSGHTAVLTPDGQRIIVYGGWVGDTNTPAEPQYAILNVASGYGGKGDWTWATPKLSGAGPSGAAGLYGHGAAMLPGGIMMVTGGSSIPSSGSKRRRSTSGSNSKTFFLNTTSNSWTTDYTPPPGAIPSEPISNSPLSSPGQKAGLGVGLGVGLAAVFGLFAFYMWYTRRLKKQRDLREKQLQELSFNAHRYNVESYSPGFDGRGSSADALDFANGQHGSYYFPTGSQGWRSGNGKDAERTGLLVEIPSPTRGLRRSLSSRPGYAMGRTHGPGDIHPIDELEEDAEMDQSHDNAQGCKEPEMSETRPKRGGTIFETAPILDPFTDPGHQSEQAGRYQAVPTSPSHLQEHVEGEPSTWVAGAASASDRLHSSTNGRLSPEKTTSERTSSNLSDRSTRSGLSWTSSSGGIGRSTSMRSSAILNFAAQVNPFKTPDSSPTDDRPQVNNKSGRQSPVDPRTHSLSSMRSNGYADEDSFRTAHSSFAQLQTEGEALLGGNPERTRPNTASSNSNTYRDTETSNSRAATATPATSVALDALSRPVTRERRKSWLGSVRRALTRSVSGSERTRSLTATQSYHEPYRDEPVLPSEQTLRDHRKSCPAAAAPPRRAASDASFWRNRRGQQDWLDEEEDPKWRRTAGDDWGAPEDIAMAERERLRQEWRDRGNLLVNLTHDDQLPTPRTPIRAEQLGVPDHDERPCTPASEGDWDVEAAVERRVVQVMFTVPKSKLRVVNADIDRSSILSLPRENSFEGEEIIAEASSPSNRVKDLAGKFEQMSSPSAPSPKFSPRASPRASPRPSPSPSIKSVKIRSKPSSASINGQSRRRGSASSPLTKDEGMIEKNEQM